MINLANLLKFILLTICNQIIFRWIVLYLMSDETSEKIISVVSVLNDLIGRVCSCITEKIREIGKHPKRIQKVRFNCYSDSDSDSDLSPRLRYGSCK